MLSHYQGEQPFAAYAKGFFAADRKYGSGDRKMISQLCYHYFRAAALFEGKISEQNMIRANFLCSQQSSPFLAQLDPLLHDSVTATVEKKLEILGLDKTTAAVFPFHDELGAGIDADLFGLSHLLQPDLFIRIRPGYHEQVKRKLDQAGYTYETYGKDCIALPNGSRLEEVLELDREAVIQDASSQEVGELMHAVEWKKSQPIQVWDCCAASGGKSILAKDIFGKMELQVSDVRASILANLSKRFRAAGIGSYQSQLADLSTGKSSIQQKFDLVIADVPCSGSGTWGRTPEQLLYFQREKIAEYAVLQQQIITAACSQLKPGAFFLYITCSVFSKENEEQLLYLQKKLRLEQVKAQYIKGYTRRADSMFVALLRKPLEAD